MAPSVFAPYSRVYTQDLSLCGVGWGDTYKKNHSIFPSLKTYLKLKISFQKKVDISTLKIKRVSSCNNSPSSNEK